MAKRALIAEPDAEEALRQAAILQDDGYEAVVFQGSDLVGEVEKNPPDLLVLRHERPGAATGLALVSRIKGVAQGTAIVLTTSELTPDAIEKNKKQRVHADHYLRLPADRADLVAATRMLPSVVESSAIATQEPVPPPLPEGRRPPPLPSLAFGQRAPKRGDAVLTAEDLSFVEKVFSSIQHIDVDTPERAEGTQTGITLADTPDRKLALLRTKLKERERDLAKLVRLWRAREEDLHKSEQRIGAKDIEAEGLRLRIQELTADVEAAQRLMVEKEAEYGRAIGETYDQHSLNEAELIQAVAAKENELNQQKGKLRRAEDAWTIERREMTDRVFEWERAYGDFEAHHWRIVGSGGEELTLLEGQILEREAGRAAVMTTLKLREHALVQAREQAHELLHALRSVEVAHGQMEAHLIAEAHKLVVGERHARIEAERAIYEQRGAVTVLEMELARHHDLLRLLDAQRVRDVAQVASHVRALDAERAKLLAELSFARSELVAVGRILDEERASGEAAIFTLSSLLTRERIVLGAQTSVRDQRITELNDDVTRLTESLSEVTARLGQSEMDHAEQQARADDLDTALAETRALFEETEARLSGELSTTTADRDRLSDTLQKTEAQLATTREELGSEKASRAQREIEVAALTERKDHELQERANKIAELERTLSDAREDIANLRKTITLRDERITELLNRVRAADEKQVQLEAQVFRLTTSNSEREADLIARDERIVGLSDKLTQRDARIENLEGDLKKTQGIVLDKQGLVERTEASLAQTQAELARTRDEGTQLRTELERRASELFESERKGSLLTADLVNARADIGAGHAIIEELQGRIRQGDERMAELRQKLDDGETKLRATLGDLEAAGQRSDVLRQELGAARDVVAQRERELLDRAQQLEQAAREHQALEADKAAVLVKVADTEAEVASLEEQLATQVRENGDLAATLGDASQRLREYQEHTEHLDGELQQREGRITALSQIVERAEKQMTAQQATLTQQSEELTENRSALEEARAAIDERARWLATREAAIAELKATLDVEKAGREKAAQDGALAQNQVGTLNKTLDETRAQAEALRTDLARRAEQQATELAAERARATEANDALTHTRAQLEALWADHALLQAQAQKLGEAQAAEQQAKLDAAKMRAAAEKAAADARAARATVEAAEATRKQSLLDVERMKAELERARGDQRVVETNAATLRSESETRGQKIVELQQQVQRFAAAHAQVTQRAQAAETAVAQVQARVDEERAQERGTLQAEITRLQTELLTARKAQRDAAAAAVQAKNEAAEIKRMAALRLQQAEARMRESGLPRTATRPPQPASAPPAPAEAYEPQPTLVVDGFVIPSAAVGDNEKG